MGTSFDARALLTARASANLAAFPYVLLRTRVPADRVSSTRHAEIGLGVNAFPRPCASGALSALNLCARADNDTGTLAIDGPSSSSRLRQARNPLSSSLGTPGSYGT
jgi:hypothetical protein